MSTVQMTYAPVEKAAKGFDATSKALKAMGKILQVVIQQLRAAAAATLGMSAVYANYLDVIRQKVEKLAKICDEFARDLRRAIKEHKAGDYQGGTYFGAG
jgi:uncharacterized protein YukE